jgi:hypothetical protein
MIHDTPNPSGSWTSTRHGETDGRMDSSPHSHIHACYRGNGSGKTDKHTFITFLAFRDSAARSSTCENDVLQDTSIVALHAKKKCETLKQNKLFFTGDETRNQKRVVIKHCRRDAWMFLPAKESEAQGSKEACKQGKTVAWFISKQI